MRTRNIRSGSGRSRSTLYNVSRGLGWFSIALGAAELAAPGRLARALGMRGSKPVLQLYGGREVAAGVGILASNDPTPWMWSRVAGDALDIATLATGLTADNPKRKNVLLALGAVVGVTALDIYVASKLSKRDRRIGRRRAVEPDYAVAYRNRSGFNKSPEAMRGAARDFEIPRDMRTPELLRPLNAPPRIRTLKSV